MDIRGTDVVTVVSVSVPGGLHRTVEVAQPLAHRLGATAVEVEPTPDGHVARLAILTSGGVLEAAVEAAAVAPLEILEIPAVVTVTAAEDGFVAVHTEACDLDGCVLIDVVARSGAIVLAGRSGWRAALSLPAASPAAVFVRAHCLVPAGDVCDALTALPPLVDDFGAYAVAVAPDGTPGRFELALLSTVDDLVPTDLLRRYGLGSAEFVVVDDTGRIETDREDGVVAVYTRRGTDPVPL